MRSPDPVPGGHPGAAVDVAPFDVAVVGGGPAGRALAGACAARGLRTALVDVTPDRPWRITYGAFTADLPGEGAAGRPAADDGDVDGGPGVGTGHEIGGAHVASSTGNGRDVPI